MSARCVHDYDVVRLRVPTYGETPDGKPTELPAGTEGTVVLEPERGSRLVQIEVVDQETGEPKAFLAAARDAIDVVWRRVAAERSPGSERIRCRAV